MTADTPEMIVDNYQMFLRQRKPGCFLCLNPTRSCVDLSEDQKLKPEPKLQTPHLIADYLANILFFI